MVLHQNTSDQITVRSPVLVLVGPTAIGKTSLSLELAEKFSCEIISMDSMQVYRHMDIGTAKPSPAERGKVPHHLIDIIDPDEQFNAAQFVRHALSAIGSITGAGKIPLLTGGTGLYLKALLQGLFDFEAENTDTVRRELAEQLAREGNQGLFDQLRKVDPETADRIHPNDTQRLLRALEIYRVTGIPWSQHLEKQPVPPVRFNRMLQIGLNCDRRLLYKRIEERTEQMMQAGLVKEVERLREMGYTSDLPSMQSIGYRHVNNYIDRIWDMEETLRLLMRDTRRYAKRQFTWFSGNTFMHWYDRTRTEDVVSTVRKWLND